MKGRMIERDVRRGWGSTLSLCNKSLAGFWVPGCSGLGNKDPGTAKKEVTI